MQHPNGERLSFCTALLIFSLAVPAAIAEEPEGGATEAEPDISVLEAKVEDLIPKKYRLAIRMADVRKTDLKEQLEELSSAQGDSDQPGALSGLLTSLGEPTFVSTSTLDEFFETLDAAGLLVSDQEVRRTVRVGDSFAVSTRLRDEPEGTSLFGTRSLTENSTTFEGTLLDTKADGIAVELSLRQQTELVTWHLSFQTRSSDPDRIFAVKQSFRVPTGHAALVCVPHSDEDTEAKWVWLIAVAPVGH